MIFPNRRAIVEILIFRRLNRDLLRSSRRDDLSRYRLAYVALKLETEFPNILRVPRTRPVRFVARSRPQSLANGKSTDAETNSARAVD